MEEVTAAAMDKHKISEYSYQVMNVLANIDGNVLHLYVRKEMLTLK